MPRFYIHFRTGDQIARDDVGIEALRRPVIPRCSPLAKSLLITSRATPKTRYGLS